MNKHSLIVTLPLDKKVNVCVNVCMVLINSVNEKEIIINILFTFQSKIKEHQIKLS